MELPRNGDPDVFRRTPFTPGELADDHVRIRVHAAGVNWADIQQRLGLYPEAPPKPYAPGYEVAGTIETAPKGSGFRKGDRVVSLSRFGGYATLLDVPAVAVAKIPKALSFEEAVAVPVVWLTAHEALFERARVRAGETVLVHGGAGGVGLAAIALAKDAGCTAHATAGGETKCRFLEESWGCDGTIDHTTGPWDAAYKDTFGRADHILDPLGGNHLRESLRCLRTGGRVIAYGASSTAAKGKRSIPQAIRVIRAMRMSAIGFMRHNTGILGLNMLPATQEEPERLVAVMEELMGRMVKGKLPKPVIAATFPLERVADAHRFLHDRANIGKVVLTVD